MKTSIMYTQLLHAHSGLRWLLLVSLLLSIIFALNGWLKKREWSKKDKLSSLILMLVMDIQFLVGFVLYAFVSPITKAAFAAMKEAMKISELRFYLVEHGILMLLALILVHVARNKSKRITPHWKRHRTVLIYYVVTLVVILAAIPWNRPLF